MLAAIGAVFGLAVGSFLNVVIHRVPSGESVLHPRSRCPRCGSEIAGRDNIPVLSWIVLRGRCRVCGAPVSARYPLVEAATAIAFAACALRFEGIEAAAFAAAATAVLLALAAIDLEHRRLPNAIVIPAAAAAAAWVAAVSIATGRPELFLRAVLCGLAAFGLFLLIAVVSGGMGFGDVKLAGLIGVVTGRYGWEVALGGVMASFFVGGAVGVVLLVTKRAGRRTAMPFGPAMAAGAFIALFTGPAPVRRWLGL